MKYRIGQEHNIVKEQDFFNSIFHDQYVKALRLIEGYLDGNEHTESPDSLQIIGFCGDRGEGKTSCMSNVRNILEEISIPEKYALNSINFSQRFAKSLDLKNLMRTRFFCMDIIDPSYFDYSHNILEILLGKLYTIYSGILANENITYDRTVSQSLFKKFEKVKRSIFSLHKKEESAYSDLTEIRMLAAAVELKEMMRSLIKELLRFTSKDKLVISIDDIDLNIKGAFEMCEQIRKYLSLPECIILIAVKPNQLEDVVASEFIEEMGNGLTMHDKDYFMRMAQRYLAKLLPFSSRIPMRHVYEFCDEPLEIFLSNSSNSNIEIIPKHAYRSLKDAIVSLIFKKTRYLFYNSKGGVSLIIPNNLRQLNALLGLLLNMEDLKGDEFEDTDILKRNCNSFKDYFYNIWTDTLQPRNKKQILQWVNETAYNVLNKNIIHWLATNFKKELDRRYQVYNNFDDNLGSSVKLRNMLSMITSVSNFSYNVSVGDLFFILSLLELDILTAEQAKMLFFIKSYYSILLFDEYNVETYLLDKGKYNIGMDAPDEEEAETQVIGSGSSQIYDSDRSFENTTWLQRLTGGSYFTFFPGELLPTDQSGDFHYDTRVINGSIPPPYYSEEGVFCSLKDLLGECKWIMKNYGFEKSRYEELKNSDSEDDIEECANIDTQLREWEIEFRSAEFFMLCISRPIQKKEISAFYNGQDSFRSVSTPANFVDFNQRTGYYVFDALAPFSNLLNPRGCYERFANMADGLFDFAVSQDFSLMSQILQQAKQTRPHIKGSSYGKSIHRLLSEVAIRNGEVLDAMRSNIRTYKNEKNRIYGIEKIFRLYDAISDSGMSTHFYEDNEKHQIRFSFLKPLQDFLKSMQDYNSQPNAKKTFHCIFDFVENLEFSTTDKDNPLREELEKKLLLIFGSGKIGRSKNVFARLKEEFSKDLENLTPSDFLRATEGKNYIIYDTQKILDFLFIPKEKARLDLWTDILGINSSN